MNIGSRSRDCRVLFLGLSYVLVSASHVDAALVWAAPSGREELWKVDTTNGSIVDTANAPELNIANTGLTLAEGGASLLYAKQDSATLYRLDPNDPDLVLNTFAAPVGFGGVHPSGLSFDSSTDPDSIIAVLNNVLGKQSGFGGSTGQFSTAPPAQVGPGGALGGDDNGGVHFVDLGVGIYKIDPNGNLTLFSNAVQDSFAGLAYDGKQVYASSASQSKLYTFAAD
ncbi:MAG: hypothetical protein MI757_10900, partial [Pirellulales bacterium]|nr:hypothetical protein [Pirellulales bacterium]